MDKTPTQWMIEPLRRYAQFSGRARRAEYWWFILFAVIVSLVASVLDRLLFGSAQIVFHQANIGGTTTTVTQTSGRYLNSVVSLALICPQLAVSFRRLHDLDRSGWWFGATPILFLLSGVVLALIIPGGVSSREGLKYFAVPVIACLIMSIILLVWFCSRGTVGPNRFGPDPLALDDGNTVALI